MTFWEHLDALRTTLLRMLAVAVAGMALAFACKEPLFRLLLAPSHSDFCTYRWIGVEPFELVLINTQLTEQFMIHLRVSLAVGLLLVAPALLYLLYRFIAPALYANEKRIGVRILLSAYLMFLIGLVVNYLLFFPLTLRFLATYSVSTDVASLLTLSSYVDTLLLMSLLFGLLFEMPPLAWLLSSAGMLRSEWMSRYRRQAIVLILILCAFITPTTDALTLLIVALPVWLLYELSILLVRLTTTQS